MERLKAPRPRIGLPRQLDAAWVEPSLRVRARYLKGSDKLRHAALTALL